MNFFERLAKRSAEIDSHVCVGLDPTYSKHDVADVAEFNRRVIEATAPYALCYKPNIAFYEQWGLPGLRALEETMAAIPSDIPVLGDIKRGDIGSTAEAYARAAFDEWGFGAVTLSPYLGSDSIDPFLAYADRAVFIVCRTSNPGAAEFQAQPVGDGGPLYELVLKHALKWGANVGLVAGATAPAELKRIRELAPDTPLLVPGMGTQGGKAAEVVAAAGARPGLLLASASRSIYYADGGGGPGDAARALRDELNQAAAAIA